MVIASGYRDGLKNCRADKGYNCSLCSTHLRCHRWVVERTHGWLAAFGKLRIQFERRFDARLAQLSPACCVICVRVLNVFYWPL
ncbi:MAG: hypothetical protein ACREYA_33740 [Cupriavidus necator]